MTAIEAMPMPNREKDQLLADTFDVLNMQRQAFGRFNKRSLADDDPTPFLPIYGGRPEPVIPKPPQPGVAKGP
jgi:hypothetical protein